MGSITQSIMLLRTSERVAGLVHPLEQIQRQTSEIVEADPGMDELVQEFNAHIALAAEVLNKAMKSLASRVDEEVRDGD